MIDEALAARYEAEARWMDLVKLLAREAEAASAPDEKATVYLRIAGIYQDKFANQAEALKAFEHVLEHAPDNRRAIDQLRALYEKRRDWERLLELEKGELDRTPPEKCADKAVEVARLAAAHVGKPDVTIYWWSRVLDYEPDHRQALGELAKSFERAEEWVQLTSILDRQVEVAPGNDDLLAALRKLAAVHEDKLADLDAARETWLRVVELAPGDAGAKRALARLSGDAADPSDARVEDRAPAKPVATLPQFVGGATAPAAPSKPAVVRDIVVKPDVTKLAIGVFALLALVIAAVFLATR